ncbi:MAG: hypothetical protein ACR2MG_02935 [Pyrinomonadaceae bacterium]
MATDDSISPVAKISKDEAMKIDLGFSFFAEDAHEIRAKGTLDYRACFRTLRKFLEKEKTNESENFMDCTLRHVLRSSYRTGAR